MARHAQAVQLAVFRIVRDDAEAEDLVQEVFLRVWAKAEQWNGQGSPRSWVLRIATNLAINHLRSSRRRRCQSLRRRPSPEEPEEQEPPWLEDLTALAPDELAELAEQRELLRRLVEQLPSEKQDVLRMVYDAGMGLAEAAESLGIPHGTAKSRLHYTIKQLMREWKELQQDTENDT
jgi:RNA polymerase sigma-70 factor (ECF subfamily)